jgi:hypothetical protein
VALWILYGFTILSAAVSAAYSIQALRNAASQAKVFTQYTLVRSLLLLGFALAAPLGGKVVVLAAGIVLLALQVGDGFIGLSKKVAAETYGPFAFAGMSTVLVVWNMA